MLSECLRSLTKINDTVESRIQICQLLSWVFSIHHTALFNNGNGMPRANDYNQYGFSEQVALDLPFL